LKALAIRQQKIHILGGPTVGGCGTPVYFDVEGDADRDFYYLIGMRSEIEGSKTQYSFWADDPTAEEKIWTDFLERLKEIDSPHLIHYGSYETQFLKRMRARYRNTRDPAFIDGLARSALNLLSVIYNTSMYIFRPTPTLSKRLPNTSAVGGPRTGLLD
jgi:predicted RecB family nuclease